MKKKILAAFVSLLIFSCGGGGGSSYTKQTPEPEGVPVRVNLLFPQEPSNFRAEDGSYRIVFLINGLGISTSPQIFDNLFPGKHSFTINVPVGGRRFMTVLISKFDNGGKEYPLYYGDVSFDMYENETTEINVLMNQSFYTQGGTNYYPKFEEKKLFGDLSGENASLGASGRCFAEIDYESPNEYNGSGKLPIKSYTVYTPFVSLNGTSYWPFQKTYAYSNQPVPKPFYTFYSSFYDSGISPVFSEEDTPFNLGSGFSWNLIPQGNHFKVPGITFDYDAGFVLEECEISKSNGTWSELQNCQQLGISKAFNVKSIGKPSGEFYLFYRTGSVNSTDVYLPYHFSLDSIPDEIKVSSEVSYLIEHFHEVAYQADRVEKDVGVKIDVPSTPGGNFTFNPSYENFTVPSGQYYVEIFSNSEVPTPVEPYYVPGWKKGIFLRLNFREMMSHQKLSFVRAVSPEGKTKSSELSLPLIPETRKYVLILSEGGNFHIADVTETSTISLKDVSITGSSDTDGRYLFKLVGSDSAEFKSCSIWFNRGSLNDSSPLKVEKLFSPDSLLPIYIYENLPADKLFVKLPDASLINSIAVECENEGGTYKVLKYFYPGFPVKPAFSYPSNFTQTGTLSFADGPAGYILANSTSTIEPSDEIFIYSEVSKNVEFEPEYVGNTYLIIYPLLYYFNLMNYFGKDEDTLTVYITDYKNGTYRKGILSFLVAESEENVTENSDGTADLTWNPNNFSQCNSTLKILKEVVPSPTANDGEEVISLSSVPQTVYLYKLCPSGNGGIVYYKKFRVIEPAQMSGNGSNGTLNTNTDIPDTATPE